MKKVMQLALAATLAVVLSFSFSLYAQNGPGCSAGATLGKAHAAFAECLAGYHAGYDVSYSASPNQYGGYTVTVYAAPKCPPGAICPLYIFYLGSVETDANCDLVSVNSVCR
jgi:hypothetical protein